MPAIKSSSDPSNAYPWFEYTFDAAALSVTFTKANGLSVATGKAPPQAEQGLLKAHQLKRSTDDTVDPDTGKAPKDEIHVLAVTLDGAVEFVPLSQQRPVYYAHLAWWDPATGAVEALEFVDPDADAGADPEAV